MSLLQLLLSISAVVFFFFGWDLYKRKKANLLHFIVFIGGSIVILFFIFNQELLNKVGNFFGIARGADLLVYTAIITLGYFYFELLHQQTKGSMSLTKLVSALAVYNAEKEAHRLGGYDTSCKNHSSNQPTKDDFVFLVRAYNEAASVGKVLDEIFGAGFTRAIVVDDGSVDATRDVLVAKKKEYADKNLILLRHLINRGPGAANKTLFQYVKQNKEHIPTWCVTYDADGQMQISDMDVFMQAIRKHQHVQVFLGSRFISGGEAQNISPMRKAILRGAKFVARFFNGIWTSDSQNGYRVIHKDILSQITLTSDRFTYATELVGEIARLGVPFVEVPVKIRYTTYSTSKGRGQKNVNAIRILLELIYKKFFFR